MKNQTYSHSRKIERFVSTLLGLAVLAVLWPAPSAAQEMRAHFINVGQGDATLLEFPCGAILIDAGADEQHTNTLAGYLTHFFQRRADLTNTLQALFITHNHIDHTAALKSVFGSGFHVRHYFDNGVTNAGSGGRFQKWVRTAAPPGCTIRGIRESEISALPGRTGLTDAEIDPLACAQCDPKIVVLAGEREENPGWSDGDFDNWNNHSLVIRVDFGKSSFLFTGDLQEAAIDTLLDEYQGTPLLNVEVYHVGHHGAANGTTAPLLQAMSPALAIISMGQWDYGKSPSLRFSTYYYGHPRKAAVELLAEAITQHRRPPVRAYLGIRSRKFEPATISHAIYATGWDGTVVVQARLDGKLKVTRPDPPTLDVPPAEPVASTRGAEQLTHPEE